MYKEPSWLKPFRRNRWDLETATDAIVEQLRRETEKVIQDNQATYDDLNRKAKMLYSLAMEVYGNQSPVLVYLRKHRVQKPPNYHKEWRKFVAAIEDARANKARREKDRERRKQRAAEKAEQERIESDQVGPGNVIF